MTCSFLLSLLLGNIFSNTNVDTIQSFFHAGPDSQWPTTSGAPGFFSCLVITLSAVSVNPIHVIVKLHVVEVLLRGSWGFPAFHPCTI